MSKDFSEPQNARKRILVTGGCGFIGANLVPRLLDLGHDIAVLDNMSRGEAQLLGEVQDRVEITVGDIRDVGATTAAVQGADAVIHLAAFGSVVESIGEPRTNFEVNALGTLSVLSACRDSGVGRVIFASTGGALIGNAVPPVDELSVPSPVSPYGASKLCGEAYCSAFAGSYGMNITALRFANVIGPISEHKKGAVTAFIKALHADAPLVIYGDGTASRDFLYVDDLCSGIVSALDRAPAGWRVYHLASEREVTVFELADCLRNLAGLPSHPIEFRPARAGEVERNFADCSRAREELGFEPVTDFQTGIGRTWEWFEARKAVQKLGISI